MTTITITLPRATVEQALEALELGYDSAKSEADQYHAAMAGFRPERHAQMDAEVQQIAAAITALRAALAQQAEPVEQTCTWFQDGDSDSGVYGTSCGHYFQIEDGTPEDNRMAWCCYCGKKLAQELIAENEDE